MTDTGYMTPEAILRHPNFAIGRARYLNSVLALHEFNSQAIELMLDRGRIMVYAALMAYWGCYREDDTATWPSMGRLKAIAAQFKAASSRQVDFIIARFAQVGHVAAAPAPHDLRVRLVFPTPTLVEHDRAFIRAHYAGLAGLVSETAYARPLAGAPEDHRNIRCAWLATLERVSGETVARPHVSRFSAASAGMLMLMKLVQRHNQSGGHLEVDFSDLGRRFCVSRTHVRTLLKAAAGEGSVSLGTRGRLRLAPDLLHAFDLNLATRMSLLDRAHAAVLRGNPFLP